MGPYDEPCIKRIIMYYYPCETRTSTIIHDEHSDIVKSCQHMILNHAYAIYHILTMYINIRTLIIINHDKAIMNYQPITMDMFHHALPGSGCGQRGGP